MTARSDSPPPVLDCARVLAYAITDASVNYIERQTLYVGGKLLGRVPRLAICQNIGEDEMLVFHCDNNWNVLGAAGGHRSAENAKAQVERAYAGIASKWVDTNVSVDQANAYLREHSGDDVCSFCGRMPHEVEKLIQESTGRICDMCIRKFSSILTEKQE